MYRGQTVDPIMQTADQALDLGRTGLAHLHAHDRGNQLQVVFDPVMNFTQQHVLLAGDILQPGLFVKNRIGHAHEFPSHIAQFRRSLLKVGKVRR